LKREKLFDPALHRFKPAMTPTRSSSRCFSNNASEDIYFFSIFKKEKSKFESEIKIILYKTASYSILKIIWHDLCIYLIKVKEDSTFV